MAQGEVDPSASISSADAAHAAALRVERRRQVRGSLLLAGTALAFALVRGGVHTIFHPGWWRLW